MNIMTKNTKNTKAETRRSTRSTAAEKKTAAPRLRRGAVPERRPKKTFARKTAKALPEPAVLSKSPGKLRIIPLGGLHEIGKNMTVVEYGDDMLIIDCGMAFPGDEMLGIDVVIPDFSYVEQNISKLRGIIITHAHEDHIGALPYFLKRFSTPIFATRLAAGFIRYRLSEHGIKGKISEIAPGDRFNLGCFKVEAVHTTHSVSGALAYAIDTPVGKIFHTGDFKIDYTPAFGSPPDLGRFARLGDEGLLLLMSDSTNALRKGYTPTEQTVSASLERLFKTVQHRIIIATFSSNIDRVKKIIELAAECGRKVAVSGRSMENMIRIASELGYLELPAATMVDIDKIKSYKDSEIIIITTGSQGEPLSALARMAANEHRHVKIKPGDMVILSATPVPGNEKSVSNVTNSLMERGAKVIDNDIMQTHVSGHASSEGLKLMLALTRPKYFMPVHGEVGHLIGHAELAENLGIESSNIFRIESGNVLEISKKSAEVLPDKVQTGAILVDGLGVGDVGSVVLNERKTLSVSGLIVLSVVFDKGSGDIICGPDLFTKGFVYVKEYGDILDEAKERLEELVMHALNEKLNMQATQKLMVDGLKKFIYEKTNRSPVIVPVFNEL